ncbi:hypothetical protein V5735_08545 (plasmid) [Haladaptatus sp. SPP-AMP-3]|uniref:hypothetical protein n=1 Tax=Haladaptatus sp. SPP-AMP-3 TaxID=3121295 RepID=UPI003C2E4FB7
MRERVTQIEVVRTWLENERVKPGVDVEFDPDEPEWALVAKLLDSCAFEASFLWRYPIAWYRFDLDESRFRRLRVIDGPENESWRRLSPDGSVLGAARRILADELTGTYDDVDVTRVRQIAAALPAPSRRLVLFKRDHGERPTIADGNHYATARAIRLLQTGEYTPQWAYLGVRRRVQLGVRDHL